MGSFIFCREGLFYGNGRFTVTKICVKLKIDLAILTKATARYRCADACSEGKTVGSASFLYHG